jgi:signal peptidase I
VDIDPPYVLIDGERLTEPAIFDTISSKQEGYSGYFPPESQGSTVSLPMTLGPGEYFLLGDNSPRSFDSRYWGPVSREKILGKAI